MFENCSDLPTKGQTSSSGSMNDQRLAFFFLKVLCPIVFISALTVFQHIRASASAVIRAIGFLPSKSKTVWANWNLLTPSAR
ncbi:hypothetical protein KCP77_09535 [Salmonella enterica subsp. enterica]|nr:hypothetical protein KCP77_09535 [Salmonella enterica subsp. enterica]